MSLRWAGKGPDSRTQGRSVSSMDTLSPEDAADGPFPAHPQGDALFGRPRRRSSSPYSCEYDSSSLLDAGRKLRRRRLIRYFERLLTSDQAATTRVAARSPGFGLKVRIGR